MCRIVGCFDFNYNNSYDLDDITTRMRDCFGYAGPDDAGIFLHEEKGLSLGHRRLSVIDLSEKGHQPMRNDNGSLWITYSGEVYNFNEIKAELKLCGYKFNSGTDTEVVLKAYEKWGIDALSRFRGMWSLAIWDNDKSKLILSRDRMGVKPLYWYYKDNLFLFASELKAFHQHPRFSKEIDLSSLALYFSYGNIPSPFSIFKNTYKLEPGCCLEVSSNGHIRKIRYWDNRMQYEKGLGQKKSWRLRSQESVVEELENILTEAFKLRMVSDVPVGIFLSGGIDSSLVTALLQKEYSKPLKTFTIGFYEKEYNEAKYAFEVAKFLGTDHTELYCTPREAFEIIPSLADIYDEPFGDSSAIPTHLVSRLAKQKVKVTLSADGGDELFCGYTRYWIFDKFLKRANLLPSALRSLFLFPLELFNSNSVTSFYEKFGLFLPRMTNVSGKFTKLKNALKAVNNSGIYLNLYRVFSTDECLSLGLKRPYEIEFGADFLGSKDVKSEMMLMDLKTYLPDDLLTKVDRAAMRVALEAREPFLDNKIVEYALKLPVEYKFRNNISKYILRKILYKYVPRKLVERPKQGFGLPVNIWFKNELRDLYSAYLNKDRIKSEGIFNYNFVENLTTRYFSGKDVNPYTLWYLLVFQLWREKWMD